MDLSQIRASTAQDEKIRFRLSALGQQITGLNDPAAALRLLDKKRRQYNDIARKTNALHQQSILALFSSLNQEKQRLDRMPAIRSSPKKKPWQNAHWKKPKDYTPVDYISPQTHYTGYWKLALSDGWRPETREGAVAIGVGERVFLYGGASRCIYNDLWVMHFLSQRWVKCQPQGVPAESRMGHTLVEHKGNLVAFGGVTAYNRGSQHRECLNSVKLLNTEKMDWRQFDASGMLVTMRRYHCAAVVGKHMFIYGGLSEKNGFLNDAAVLNLKKQMWKSVDIQGKGPGHVAFHAAVAVYHKEIGVHPGLSLFRTPGFEAQPSQLILRTGIYVFGGLDANSIAHNTLYLCETGQRPLVWATLETTGSPPAPRFQHTLTYMQELNVLVVYGGRNDTHSGGGYTCFNDVHILNLSTLVWAQVNVRGQVPSPKCAHAAAAVSTQLITFGGVDGGKYCSSDTYILELDQKLAMEWFQEDVKREEREATLELQRKRDEVRAQSTRNSTRSRSVGVAPGIVVQGTRGVDASFFDTLGKPS